MIKNDNLNVMFQIGNYRINVLKFTYECQTWNTPSHAHSSNSYEIHFIPEGNGTLISNQCRYDLYPDILYTTGPHIEHQQYSDPDDPTYEYCIYLRIEELHNVRENVSEKDILAPFLHYPFWYGKDCAGFGRFGGIYPTACPFGYRTAGDHLYFSLPSSPRRR